MNNPTTQSALATLAHYVATHGPILTVRVSSAQAVGRAKQYLYWGAVRYQIRETKAGYLSNVACERASSDRRSERLAAEDAATIEAREGRRYWDAIGPVSEHNAAALAEDLGLSGECSNVCEYAELTGACAL